MEIWVPITGYEEEYEVSSLGRVLSKERKILMRNSVEITKRQRILQAADRRGYKRVVLCKQGTQQVYSVHRLVAQEFIPNPENKPFINHINCNPADNRVENLEWVTAKENNDYIKTMNRLNKTAYHAKGSKTRHAALHEDLVKEIRERWQPGQTKELAERYNITYNAMRYIICGVTWKHVVPNRAILLISESLNSIRST